MKSKTIRSNERLGRIKIRNELQVKLKNKEKSHFKLFSVKTGKKNVKMMRGKREREKGRPDVDK